MAKRASGSTRNLVEITEDDVSYFKEMLTSSAAKWGLGAAVVAMVPAAIIAGPAFALFPLIAYAGSGAIAGLFIPSSPVFRHRVNRKLRAERRVALRRRFLEKLAQESGRTEQVLQVSGMSLLEAEVDPNEWQWHPDVEEYRSQYIRMVQRLENLRQFIDAGDSEIGEEDIERLEDATIDFLRLIYARKNVLERMHTTRVHEVQRRIRELEVQAESAPPHLAAKLKKAKEALERTAEQQSLLPARNATLGAQLLHMSETFEELYHRVTSDPGGSDLSAYLEQAAEKMSIEEELEWAAEAEVHDLVEAKRRVATKARQREKAQG